MGPHGTLARGLTAPESEVGGVLSCEDQEQTARSVHV